MRWNLEEIYQTQDMWTTVCCNFKKKYAFIYKDHENYISYIPKLEYAYKEIDTLYTYALLKYYQNTEDESSYQNLTLISSIFDDFALKMSTITKKIIENEYLFDYLEEDNDLAIYTEYYLRIKKENDSTDLINQVYDTLLLGEQLAKLLDFDSKVLFSLEHGNEIIQITHQNLIVNLNHLDRQFRKQVCIKLENKIKNIQDEVAIIYSTHFKILNLRASYENIETSFEYSLNNNVIGMTLEDFLSIKPQIKKIYQKILKFKQLRLCLDDISFYDLYIEKKTISISLLKAKEIALKVFKKLGNEFFVVANLAFDENWFQIDDENQRNGSRSISCPTTHPYIMINWQNDLESLYAMVHELGGAIAQYFASKSKSFIYSELSIFKTELISSVSEIILSNILLENFDEDLVIDKVIDNVKDSLFIPYEMSLVEYQFSKKCLEDIPNSEDFSNIYENVVNDFHEYDNFIHLEENRF